MGLTNHEEIWNNCLTVIRNNVSHQNFKIWFEPILPVSIKDNILTIQVPSQFFYEWLEENYITLLKKTIKKELGKEGKLEYHIVLENSSKSKPYVSKIPSSNQKDIQNYPVSIPMNLSTNKIRNPFIIPGLQKININPQLNKSYTFDAFVEGECNRLARSAGYAVAQDPGGTSFNPLFIYGSGGLGKTHLANAIGIDIKKRYPEKTVLYTTAEKFTQQYIEAVKKNNRNDFIYFYQIIDVLIIDDIQFFSGKPGTQDVFFHIFNHLHQNGRQVVLTSDKPPVDMQDIELRLLSRFKWGLSAELQKPDFETRVSILKNKLYRDGIEMNEDVIHYVAKNIKSNVRELEGAIISLIAQASFNRKEINIALAKEIIEKFVKNTKREVSIDYIQKIVSDYFQMDIPTLQSKTRKRHIVQARQLAMFFAKKYTKASLASIGSQIGKRDHATVLHACKTVDNLSSTDKQFRKFVEDLGKKLSV
jgi:chromosomal replication initiator protein